MPKSIPTNGQTNWGTALNSHLGQIMDPTYGGFNLWNNTTRPWQDGDTTKADFENKTGYNTELEIFERWVSGPSAEDCYWKTIKPAGKSNGFKKISGTFRSATSGFLGYNMKGKLLAEGGANFNSIKVGDVIRTTPAGALFPSTAMVVEKNSSTEITLNTPIAKNFYVADQGIFNTNKTITSGPAGSTSITCSGDMSSIFEPGDYLIAGYSFGSVLSDGKMLDHGVKVVGVSGNVLTLEVPFRNFNFATGSAEGTIVSTGFPIFLMKTNNTGLSISVNVSIFSVNTESNKNIIVSNEYQTTLNGYVNVYGKPEQGMNGINIISDNDGSYLQFFAKKDNSLINKPERLLEGNIYTGRTKIFQFADTYFTDSTSRIYINSFSATSLHGTAGINVIGSGASGGLISVGIGTDAPNAKLHVGKGIGSLHTGYIPNGSLLIKGDTGDRSMFEIHSPDGTGRTVIQNLNGGATYISNVDGNNLFLQTSGGNVGISTTDPSQKLHVAGNILATGTVTQNSDINLKKDIVKIDGALNKLSQIKGVTYKWKNPENHGDDETEQLGVIAQDVEKVFPQAVSTDPNGIKSVSYGDMVAPLIEAIKELKAEIEELKKKVA